MITGRSDDQLDVGTQTVQGARDTTASRTLRRFKTVLPELYSDPKYYDGVGFIRYGHVPASHALGGRQNKNMMHEEEAAVWLWYLAAKWPRQPALPGWPCPIEWILTFVTGNNPWPGDLWGVDRRGELVIVEDKMAHNSRLEDPFEDFLSLVSLPQGLRRPEFTVEKLRPKWEKQLSAERDGRPNGILPHSSHRIATHHWGLLTEKTRRRLLGSKKYSKRVNSYLDERKRKGNPDPHFAGLILLPNDHPPSQEVREKWKEKELVKQVGRDGPDHVHLFLAYAKRAAESTARCCVERVP